MYILFIFFGGGAAGGEPRQAHGWKEGDINQTG
jgi:hypothetical protein